ncbi:hypothetical protein DH2020_027206 [Rehmannia glutinosa]|uniref:Uncharacterized protein n=1 Tax=Rehmannia glutinosa TaxID=99300 RepID=A0ABR0VXP0_REHGL
MGDPDLVSWGARVRRGVRNRNLRAIVVRGIEGGGGTNRSDKGLNLSGSWQQGHSAAYNTPSRRADIEGSKSNVAMNAWLPQAAYPLWTLRYLLTDVPPQPNSPPDNVFRPDRPAEASLGSKKRGIAPPPIHGISKITLKVVVFHFRLSAPTYPTPLKSFHKVGLESSSTEHWAEITLREHPQGPSQCFVLIKHRIPLVRTRFESTVRRPGRPPKEPFPSPPGQARDDPLSRREQLERFADDSRRRLFTLETDAVMSTTGRGRHSVLRIFKGRGRTDTTRRAVLFSRWTLPPAEPFRGGQAVKQKKITLPEAPADASPDSLTLPSAAASRFRNFNPIPFRSTR